MALTVYFDSDIAPEHLTTRKVAIIGYGAQGSAHALNLRESGVDVIIGQRAGASFDAAVKDGFDPLSVADAVRSADVICLMLPDELHGTVFEQDIVPALSPGNVLLVCHGFSLHYKTMVPPNGVAAILVAPKGAGHMVRSAFQQGSGVPCLVALGPNTSRDEHFPLALAYAGALGGGRAGIMETTVKEETETDLFGEQAVLCGGVSHLAVAAWQTLVDAGYRPEVAYFECVHELKLVVDLIHRGGLAFMRDHISNTAEFGDYTAGPTIIDDHVRKKLRDVLHTIQSGEFARHWIEDTSEGGKQFAEFRAQHQRNPIESTGKMLHERLKL